MNIKKFAVIFLSVVFCIMLSACQSSTINLCNVSELHTNYFRSDGDWGYAELSCGYREEPFDYDGKSNKKVKFGVVKVVFAHAEITEQILKINLYTNSVLQHYELERNPIDFSFMVDIEELIDDNSKIRISFEKQTLADIEFTCLSKDWKVSCNTAADIANLEFKEYVEEASKNKLNYECYLTILRETGNVASNYFWAFTIRTSNGKTANIAIDVNNGAVVLKSIL